MLKGLGFNRPQGPEVVQKAGPVSTRMARSARRRRRQRLGTFMAQVLILGLVLLLMQLLNSVVGNLALPTPGQVWTSFLDIAKDGTLGSAIAETLIVFSIGFVIAGLTGVLLGVITGGISAVGRVLDPYINALNATPRIAFIPLIIVWFGLADTAKIIVTWLSAVIPIMIYTAGGIEVANHELLEMAKAFGIPRRVVFWKILLPGALPSILTGLRVGSALAVLGTIVAEMFLAQGGLGGLLSTSGSNFNTPQYFAVIAVLMVLGAVVNKLLRMVERRGSRWRISVREEN